MPIRKIDAKYDGYCYSCNLKVSQGETCFYDTDAKKIICPACHNNPENGGKKKNKQPDFDAYIIKKLPSTFSKDDAKHEIKDIRVRKVKGRFELVVYGNKKDDDDLILDD